MSKSNSAKSIGSKKMGGRQKSMKLVKRKDSSSSIVSSSKSSSNKNKNSFWGSKRDDGEYNSKAGSRSRQQDVTEVDINLKGSISISESRSDPESVNSKESGRAFFAKMEQESK